MILSGNTTEFTTLPCTKLKSSSAVKSIKIKDKSEALTTARNLYRRNICFYSSLFMSAGRSRAVTEIECT